MTITLATLIMLGFFGYAMTGGGGVRSDTALRPEISAVGHAIATKFCTRIAPDVIYMIA